ncbi:MAG: sugar ABC transporter permease [Tessaracoccus sp.]|nr:sugar ABC transporter permease [Tessaracoccus sp.]
MFPLLYTAFVSVHQWGLITGNKGFVGLKNYTDVLNQPRFWQGMGNTFSIFLLSSVPQLIIAVFVAAVLDANLRAKTFWRMGVLVPYVVAPVAVGLIFNSLFADQSGFVNAVLTSTGLPAVGWHAEPLAAHVAIATMVNFRWTGYNTLIVLAAMQAIPRDIIEAAVVDGASRVRTFFSVTVPMLRPTLIFVIITSTIGGLQIFDEPRMFDQIGLGGNNRQWMTITMFMYEVGWGSQRNFGRAAAVAWILFLVIVAFALINFWLTSRIAGSGAAPAAPRRRTKGGSR